MKKILFSLGTVVFVAAVALSATGAFFSDTETSTGNTFTAGAIDLKIDNTSYVTDNTGRLVASPNNTWQLSDLTNQLFFSFTDLKPGDVGEDTISVHAGTNDAWACMAAKLTSMPDNGINDPETSAGDVTNGALGGELQNFLNFYFWNDDGDNVLETNETQITQLSGPASSIFNGTWLPLADSGNGPAIPGNSIKFIGKAWCFGTLTPAPVAQDGVNTSGPLIRGTGVTCDGSGDNNIAQTDGIGVDVSFQAVQARNNGQFLCSTLPPFNGGSALIVHQTDLSVTDTAFAADAGDKWFFYDDTADTGMSIDKFIANGGQNHMDTVASEQGAKMLLHDGSGPANPRYNIATYQFQGTLLNAISALKFRVYDATADSDTPFIQFNVDFATSTITGGFQSRLTMQPGTGGNPALAPATWTTVDAISGGTAMWTWSGLAKGADKTAATADDNKWPDGNASVYRSWNDIVTAFPNAKILTPGGFLGVRDGQPGPAGATDFVSSIQFSGIIYDFQI